MSLLLNAVYYKLMLFNPAIRVTRETAKLVSIHSTPINECILMHLLQFMTKIWLFIVCIGIKGLNALGRIASKDS